MAVSSYLPDTAGGMVAAASFSDDAAVERAIGLLADSGVLPQELSVICADRRRAAALAGARAWYPGKDERGVARLLHPVAHRLPRELRARYAAELRSGAVVLVAAAGGQPPDTLAALFTQAGGRSVAQWWQPPADLFAPPELAGPF
jgi:hypothetical protein